ncbi:DNA-binding response regulator [Roseobacter denitrificans]|uniref:Two-component response regulator, putative n=1 Tax=Roseobacter denitrificans (strain ATCC 33942 / OCh 114) TaxID=375451 RepID=Q162M0_ROSDO|nr:DNA-binding response regulator [Roseobacter denitrificans]ABG33073.1 two-component response regulator, putative [Roseobacter denitrificans OCh 114]AVL54832.1 DNA-binding response regulator [Roseobacter denitrificans]SFG08434.1 two component transcriptional regulator, LuxR family [Roseobacter denitrificans OCh 114]
MTQQIDTSDRRIALVVDDSPETLSMVSTALEENGISAVVATNGQAGYDLATRILPDVILLDAMMPGLDGFETCALLKADERLAYAPVIFMTGLSDSEHIIRGLQVGGVDYVMKPAVIDELIARITIHILNSRAIQSARQALDASGRSVIAVSAAGVLLWGSPTALRVLRDTENVEPQQILGGPVFKSWLDSCIQLPTSQTRRFSCEDFTLDFLGGGPSGELLLQIARTSNMRPSTYLETAFDLTPREAEVLYWLSMGKTNRDIAQILSLSSRTINKHLEQVFQKMGVDNRTAAAVAADRLISRL